MSASLGPDGEDVETPTLLATPDSLADLAPTRAVAQKFVDAIVQRWPDYPEAEGLALAARVGPILGPPLLSALSSPKNKSFGGRPLLTRMAAVVGATGAAKPTKAPAGKAKPSGKKKRAS